MKWFFLKKKLNKKDSTDRKILGLIFAGLSLLAGFFSFLRLKRLAQFIKGQKREIKELSNGQETWRRFFKDSGRLLKDSFIPHAGNNHKPKALRPKSLWSYVVLAVLIKVGVTGFLFFTYPNPAQLSAIVTERMLALVNESRTEAGLEPLDLNLNLVTAAQAKGQDMMSRQYFAHDTPEGKKPWQWIDRAVYDYVFAGENLAIDFKSAEVVHDALMKSPTHRRNILNPRYKELGLAVLEGDFDNHETTLLVEFFGTQRQDLNTLALAAPEAAAGAIEPPAVDAPNSNIAGQETSEPVSAPGPEALTSGVANEGVIVITAQDQSRRSLVDFVIEYSNIFFIAFLIFILVSLLLNIFIKIQIQHSSMIVQTIAVAALITAMILVKFHFAEQISSQLLIL